MDRPMHLYSHGGVVFWMISSSLFAFLYALALSLPVLPCKRWITPPNQKTFYHYMFFMLILYIVQVCLDYITRVIILNENVLIAIRIENLIEFVIL